MGPDCFSNCSLFDDCASLNFAADYMLLQFRHSFDSVFPFSPFGHKTFYVIRPLYHGFRNLIWHIFYSFLPFKRLFVCPILGRTGANGSVDVATKIINTGILQVSVINRIVRGTVTYCYTTPGRIFALYHTFSWRSSFCEHSDYKTNMWAPPSISDLFLHWTHIVKKITGLVQNYFSPCF